MSMEEKCVDLVEEAMCSKLQPFKFDKVRKVCDEIQMLYQLNQLDVRAALQGSVDMHCAIQDRHFTIERATRCLVAFMHERLMKLKQMRWQLGAVLPSTLRENLAEHEIEWFRKYSTDLAVYMQSIDNEGALDLTQFSEPPENIYSRVKCTEDYGEFESEDGTTYTLVKDSEHLIPKHECEALVRQGVLEII